MKIIEIVRLTELGYSQRDIAKSTDISKTTVGSIQKIYKSQDLDYKTVKAMTADELDNHFYPDRRKGKPVKADPDFDYIHHELTTHRKLNLRFMWEKYIEDIPYGLSYSQFCSRYRSWRSKTGKELTMHQEHIPGKELEVDWMGDLFYGVVDPETGEISAAHIFVATLGYSGMPYAEAFSNEKTESWLMAHRHAFEYYEGLPLIVIPDNCRTAVNKANHYDPQLNPTYQQFADHYNVAVIPARVRKPKDKPTVEQSVGWLETWLLGEIRNQTFFSFKELNKELRRLLKKLCYREFQKREGSRYSNFIEFDKPALTPLPLHPFERTDTVPARVPDNYHVTYDGHYYSVPHELYGQKIHIKATALMIEIYTDHYERTTSHQRSYGKKLYVTEESHMPEHHRKYHEDKRFDDQRYRNWAGNIGPDTYKVIDILLDSVKVKEQVYKSCMGILQMSKKYTTARLECACGRALAIGSCRYATIRNILKNGQDLLDTDDHHAAATPDHSNIRGAKYYGERG